MGYLVHLSVIVVIIHLIVYAHCRQVPAAPTGVTASNHSSNSIMVKWNALPNITVYQVHYKKSDDVLWNTNLVAGNQSSVLIGGLTPYTVYVVRIRTNGTGGISNFSIQVQVRTDEAPPSELPKITSIKAFECCSIYLEWNPIPADKTNGKLLGYQVYYLKTRDMIDFENKYKIVHLNITPTRANITGLHPYTKYIVGIAAYNSKGIDKNLVTWAHVKTVKTLEGAPSPPSGLKGKFDSFSEFVIQWTLIPADKANGILLGYRYVVYNNLSEIENNVVSNTTSSVRVTKMSICADYTVHVRAWTAARDGMNAVFNFTNRCASLKISGNVTEVIVNPHTSAILPCNYNGYPPPSVTWMMNDRNTAVTLGQKPIEHQLNAFPNYRYIKPLPNGSLEFSFVVYSDTGLYTCFLNNSYSSAEVNITMIVDESAMNNAINSVFLLNLINETFHNDLLDYHSSAFKNLRNAIRDEVLRLYPSTKKAKVIQVARFSFSKDNGTTTATFIVTAEARPGISPEDAKYEILDTMITQTKDGKLGQIAVGQVIVKGAPPPPEARIISRQPSYVVLLLTRGPFYKQYEVNSYSIRYRKHEESEDRYKTVDTVTDKDGTMKGVVNGLDPGQFYYVGVASNRNDNNIIGDKRKFKTLEVATPDIMMKQWMLTFVLPVALAIIIALVILLWIRPQFMKREQNIVTEMQVSMENSEPVVDNTYDIQPLLAEFPCRWIEIPRENLTPGKELGSGAFGSVVKAELKRDGKSMPCAIKKLKRFATEREHRDLFNELSIMTQVGNHTNVMSLIGACTENGPLWVIVKLAECGSLLDYLHKHRKPEYADHAYMNVNPSTSNDGEELDKLQKLKFAHGIAKGMSHIEKMKCIHRDLAARNVLLGKGLVPMVSDFGLSRDIYVSGMYEDVKGGKRPVRWMAPEAVEDYTCTIKSDVWSYGVTLWEIETAGTVPYAGVDSGMDILNEIKRGYRLEKPQDCDDDVYQFMLDTWKTNPLDRPSFKEIVDRLDVMLCNLSEYLVIQNEEDEDERPYDLVEINEEELANGYVAQDGNPGVDDSSGVRYTDIQGSNVSNTPSNNKEQGPSGQPLTVQDVNISDDESSLSTKC